MKRKILKKLFLYLFNYLDINTPNWPEGIWMDGPELK